MKLSKAQQELYEAMKNGTIVYYMGAGSHYFFRDDTMKRCTNTVMALESKGLLERFKEDWKGYKLRVKPSKPKGTM